MAAIGCGISHKDTDKCSNNKTKKPQINIVKVTQKM
jgi:hypothetical protein